MTKTFIALLRGINVSGQKLIKMETLRLLLADAGLENVRTYIQSGNVIFESAAEAKALELTIQSKIHEHFGFDVAVIVVTPSDLEDAVGGNPFSSRTLADAVQPYIDFMSEAPAKEKIDAFRDRFQRRRISRRRRANLSVVRRFGWKNQTQQRAYRTQAERGFYSSQLENGK